MTTAAREELAMQAWNALKGATTAMFLRMKTMEPAGGAQPGHMGFLHALAAADGPLTPTQLAACVGVTPATVTGAITSLEELRLIVRTRDPADRRAVKVSITTKGREVQRKWHENIRAHIRQVTEPLSDEELATVARLLAKVAPPIEGPPRDMLAALRHDLPPAKGAQKPRGKRR